MLISSLEKLTGSKHHSLIKVKLIALGVLLTATTLPWLAGCSANRRQVQFYLLQPISPAEAQAAAMETTNPIVVGMGPVEVPSYLDRPQIVSGMAGAELQLAEYHRWAEPLKDTVTRVLTENLGLLMPKNHVIAFPWNRAVNPDFQVEVKLSRFHMDATGNCELKADWTILKQNKPVLMKEFQVRTAAANSGYEDKVAAQSQTLGKFAKSIAAGLQTAAVLH